MTTLREEVLKLKRRYKYVNRQRMFYTQRADLKKKSQSITCWLIVQSKHKGTFVMEFKFKRSKNMSAHQWGDLWTKGVLRSKPVSSKAKHRGKKKYETLYNILTDTILPNISIKYHDDWRFVDLIGWSMGSGFYKRNNSASSTRH